MGSCSEGTPASPRLEQPPRAEQVPAANGRNLRRLSRREYDNVVRDLLGDTTEPALQFGLEVYVNGFDNGSGGLTVQGTDVDAFQAAAESLAARAVATRLGVLLGGCDPKRDEAACVEAFLGSFPKRAYRRPPTLTELQRLRAVYEAGAAAGGFRGGIQLMLEAILQSPAFLYRAELGAPDPLLAAGLVRLTDYEVASELSFLVTGSMPDDALFAAVEGGRLKTGEDLRREAVRLMHAEAARPAFRSFLHQWAGTDQLASLSKDSGVYPSFNQALAQSMTGELDAYFDDVLWSGSGSLRELFTSTRSLVDPPLAALYQVRYPGTGPGTGPGAARVEVRGSGFQPVALDAKTRQGLLTRAGFLAVHADVDSSGPVPRGVFVLNAILCSPPSPPPANVPPAPPVTAGSSSHQTTRQRFFDHVSQPLCKTCHSVIDGVGFGFEEFDGMGVYRTTENGAPVDTSGHLLGTDVDGPFVGVSALAAKLATSQDVLRCFVRQVYRFGMGQEESAESAPLLASLEQGFSARTPVTDLFLSLVTDPAFVVRRAAP